MKESQIVNRMYDEYRKDHPITLTDQEVLEAVGENKQEDMPKHSKSGIVVKGLYDVAVHFSKCCSPVPGDEIVGFVTRGRGVSIHRTDCVNILHLSDMERVRLIELSGRRVQTKNSLASIMRKSRFSVMTVPDFLWILPKYLQRRRSIFPGFTRRPASRGSQQLMWPSRQKARDRSQKLWKRSDRIEGVMDVERTTG